MHARAICFVLSVHFGHRMYPLAFTAWSARRGRGNGAMISEARAESRHPPAAKWRLTA